MSVVFQSHRQELLSASEEAKKKALWAIGATAEGHAKDVITSEGRVDTGRMRNSISHAEDEESTYVGTNVEYAIYNELGTVNMSGIHMLQKAATGHTKEYKELAKEAYKNG